MPHTRHVNLRAHNPLHNKHCASRSLTFSTLALRVRVSVYPFFFTYIASGFTCAVAAHDCRKQILVYINNKLQA